MLRATRAGVRRACECAGGGAGARALGGVLQSRAPPGSLSSKHVFQGAHLQVINSEVLGRIIEVDTLVDADQVDESMSYAQVEEDEAATMMLHKKMKQNLSSKKLMQSRT